MHKLRMRGVTGQLRKGYQVVAHLGSWTEEAGRVEANVASVNQFWIDQGGPFELWLSVGRRFWIWKNVSVLARDDRTIAIRVDGSPENRAAV